MLFHLGELGELSWYAKVCDIFPERCSCGFAESFVFGMMRATREIDMNSIGSMFYVAGKTEYFRECVHCKVRFAFNFCNDGEPGDMMYVRQVTRRDG